MDRKLVRRFGVTMFEDGKTLWRRAKLKDLPKIEKLLTDKAYQMFGFCDIARVITDNSLSLCQIDCNDDVTFFISFSDRPTIVCVACDRWTEWFDHFYDLNDVNEYNTLFVHVFLFRCVESLDHLPVLFKQVYIQMSDINNVIFLKLPRTKICARIRAMFTALPAKNVTYDAKFGCPEIWYHTRERSINQIHLREAQVDDFIDLRAYLGGRLDFLDKCYGEYSLAKILEYPGQNRLNFVPLKIANGLITIYLDVDYQFLDNVFELRQFTGLIEFEKDQSYTNNVLQIPGATKKIQDIKDQYDIALDTSIEMDGIDKIIKKLNAHIIHQRSSDMSIYAELYSSKITENSMNFDYQHVYNNKPAKIVLMDSSKYSSQPIIGTNVTMTSSDSLINNTTNAELIYKKTAFMIELMLIDEIDEDTASWEYFVKLFNKFPQYEYCLLNLRTTSLAKFKKYFCRVFLKPNRSYPMGQLFILHRSSVFGKFTCELVTEEHLEIIESLIETHPFKNVISDNISKSVFEDTRYKSFIFFCDNKPIGYCVIRLNYNMKYLCDHFDVSRYVYPSLACNRSAILLNMDFKRILLKRTRYYLKRVMEASNLNCLFYILYSDSTTMEYHKFSYISGLKELIPVRPRFPIRFKDENEFDHDEKFALYHINMRMCTVQKMSMDVKIVVVGASIAALSFLESLVFNPVNQRVNFENIVLVSNYGLPYQTKLTGSEDCMVPKVAHYNYDYMKSIGLFTFVNVKIGTVTAIDSFNKFIIINENEMSYDYLFLFNGEQFTYSVKEDEVKSNFRIKLHSCSTNNDTIENLFLLNSERDAVYAHNYIKTMKNDNKIIIVYGNYLESLTVINVLLENNIDGSRIVYVRLNYMDSLFSNEFIAKAVHDELQKQGVRVFKRFNFDSWRLNKNKTKIERVTFKSDKKNLEINCAGLFWFDRKRIQDINRLWIIKSMIRFDGHLIVNSSFETSNENVYAAGPVAKFKQDRCSHTRYNSVEIGARVAGVLLEQLNIVEDRWKDAKFVQPLTEYCRLPGKYNYLHAIVPGLMGTQKAKVLKTRNADRGYFEIAVNDEGKVLELFCYSKVDFKYTNLIHVCGKNVESFNDFKYRLYTKSIPCFFDYFEEPWAYPMYSDRFEKFMENTTRILNKNIKCDNLARLISKYNTKKTFKKRFNETFGPKLREVASQFLIDDVDYFPAYARPAFDLMRSFRDRAIYDGT